MHQEVAAASTFLSTFLPPTAPPSTFANHLTLLLATRYADHWHPTDPERGSAFRALVRSSATTLDSSVVQAAAHSGLNTGDIERALASGDGKIWLGDRWTLWVDPGCVSLRIDRGDGTNSRDGQFIEIYGKLPESLRSHAVPLATLEASVASVNISTPTLDSAHLPSSSSPPLVQDANLLSPTKRSSKAIQILPPPTRPASTVASSAATALTSAALRPSSPLKGVSTTAPTALLASPLIIPPTPLRPLPSSDTDVFSPTPSTSMPVSNLGPRSPSPLAGSYSSLSPSPTGFPLFTRRSSSRGSSFSSSRSFSEGSSDGEGSDGIFSSTESLGASSTTSAGTTHIVMDGEFKYPPLPVRPSSTTPFALPSAHAAAAHPRSHSSASNHALGVPPMSPSKMLHPHGLRSLPCSPSKPRRRGTRGGSGQGSQSYAAAHGTSVNTPAPAHESHSSISSMTSITSNSSSSTSTSRTREQALAGTLTEHSGGKVGVLGGGVLLGLAGAKMMGSARGEVVGEAKRRGRERRRGGQRQGHKEGVLYYPGCPQPGQGWEHHAQGLVQ